MHICKQKNQVLPLICNIIHLRINNWKEACLVNMKAQVMDNKQFGKSPENQTGPVASLECLHLLSSGCPLAMANR